jgi:NADH-quinone oxidoreductase subunit L
MLHMFGNASLRCYQLLVSPSSIAFLLRQQGSKSYQSKLKFPVIETMLPKRIASSLYVFALNDGFLEKFVRGATWTPMTSIGKFINRHKKFFILGLGLIAIVAVMELYYDISDAWRLAACIFSIFGSLSLTFTALAEKDSSVRAWNAVALSNALAALAVMSHDPHILREILIFGSGIVFFWTLGLQSLLFLRGSKATLALGSYQGLIQSHPGSSFLLFLGVLGVSGFPISPAFIGQDMLLHHSVDNYVWLTVLLAVVFSVNGLALMRIYAKVCLGSGVEFASHHVLWLPASTRDFDQ